MTTFVAVADAAVSKAAATVIRNDRTLGDYVTTGKDRQPARGHRALEVMEKHIAGREWFVGEAMSLADIALYAYTHAAEEGEFDLGRFPAVREWIGRVAAEPGHVPIDA